MKTKKINLDYFSLWKEVCLFWLLVINKAKYKTDQKSDKILIVVPCLIGEFGASLHAISDFIQKNKDKTIDIVVSPPLKSLAEKIIGIRKVFIAKSVFKRKLENFEQTWQHFDTYEKIIFLRISRDSYNITKNIKANKIIINAWPFTKYALHLLKNVLLGRTPKQWREFNFEIFDSIPRNFAFDEIFYFKDSDCDRIKKLDELQTSEKKVVIHTGSNWLMKKWDNEKWVELIQKINKLGNHRFIFIGTKDDTDDYEYISSKLGFKNYSLINQVDLMELALVLRASDYFIGVDSGPKNMAYLADTPSVAILGPGPHFYMPYRSNHMVIDKSNGRGLYQYYFYKKNSFIGKITVEEVFAAFKNLV